MIASFHVLVPILMGVLEGSLVLMVVAAPVFVLLIAVLLRGAIALHNCAVAPIRSAWSIPLLPFRRTLRMAVWITLLTLGINAVLSLIYAGAMVHEERTWRWLMDCDKEGRMSSIAVWFGRHVSVLLPIVSVPLGLFSQIPVIATALPTGSRWLKATCVTVVDVAVWAVLAVAFLATSWFGSVLFYQDAPAVFPGLPGAFWGLLESPAATLHARRDLNEWIHDRPATRKQEEYALKAKELTGKLGAACFTDFAQCQVGDVGCLYPGTEIGRIMSENEMFIVSKGHSEIPVERRLALIRGISTKGRSEGELLDSAEIGPLVVTGTWIYKTALGEQETAFVLERKAQN